MKHDSDFRHFKLDGQKKLTNMIVNTDKSHSFLSQLAPFVAAKPVLKSLTGMAANY